MMVCSAQSGTLNKLQITCCRVRIDYKDYNAIYRNSNDFLEFSRLW